MPPAAKNLFEKRFLDFQKLFIKVFFIALFLRVPSCSSWLTKIGGESRAFRIVDFFPDTLYNIHLVNLIILVEVFIGKLVPDKRRKYAETIQDNHWF
jgi:hypothetical protein